MTRRGAEVISTRVRCPRPGITTWLSQASRNATRAASARIAASYGTLASAWLDKAETREDLGEEFGGGLSAAEVDYLMRREWAETAEDVLWRRTKTGLRVDADGRARLERYMEGAVRG